MAHDQIRRMNRVALAPAGDGVVGGCSQCQQDRIRLQVILYGYSAGFRHDQ